MTDSQLEFSVDAAKSNFICRTSLLEPYKEGLMFLLQKAGSESGVRAVYRVESGPITVIFKTISCSATDSEAIRQIKDEIDLSIKAYQIARDGVVALISFKKIEKTDLNETIFEIVYEYGGDNFLTAFKDANGQKIMDAMETVAKIMARLESENIFHSDIKPENIVISNGVVKLVDFGVSMKFDTKTSMLVTKELMGGTSLYLPPEVLETEKGKPTTVDAYSWGITLYQLLTGRTKDNLIKDQKLQTPNYKAFLDNVQKFLDENVTDENVKRKAKIILPKVLAFNPNERPNFFEIIKMLSTEEEYKQELEKTKQILEETKQELIKVTKERDVLKKIFEEFYGEENKTPVIRQNIGVYFFLLN